MIQIHTQQEGSLGEFADLPSAFDKLKACQMESNMAVVRVDGDDDYFQMFVQINAAIQRAGNGAVLSGGAVAAWQIMGSFPDGGGWRFVIGTAVIQAQPRGPMPRIARG